MHLEKIEDIDFPTTFGGFDLSGYKTAYPDQPNMHYTLVIKSKKISDIPVIRIHSECMLSEIFHSTHCDCSLQLESALRFIQKKGGILFYLNQEGRGHGLETKLREMKKQQIEGLDTVEASQSLGLDIDNRKYNVVADILKLMGISKVKILTNNPKKIEELELSGIEVHERIPLEPKPSKESLAYLHTKKDKLGHMLSRYVN